MIKKTKSHLQKGLFYGQSLLLFFSFSIITQQANIRITELELELMQNNIYWAQLQLHHLDFFLNYFPSIPLFISLFIVFKAIF
jgi:hypothetical protein